MVVFSSLATLLASMLAIRAEMGTLDLVENDPCLESEYPPVATLAPGAVLSDTEFLLEVRPPYVI